jgi:ribonuclease Z
MGIRTLQLTTSWGPLTIAGGSRAGEGTLILLPQLKLALDAGRPHRSLPPMSTVLVSHGHMDHLGGLGYWASQRQLNRMGPGTAIAPEHIADGIAELLDLHARLEGGKAYQVEIAPVADDDRLAIRSDMELSFFATDHWVPTLGATLSWRRRRLRSELAGLPGEEIARRRYRGEAITVDSWLPLLSYCADSGPRLLSERPGLLAAEVVLMECSFFREADRDRAERYGHLHLEDLLAVADSLGCRHLVLLHASRRHRLREVEEELEKRLRPRLPCPLHHLVVDWE